MSEPWVEKTRRSDGIERFELHLGVSVYVVSLERGEKIARGILGLLDIDVAQLETECNRLYGVGQDIEEMRKQLDTEVKQLQEAANSLLGLIDCLGGRRSLDDAGPDRKNLAELVNYPDMNPDKVSGCGGE